MDFSGSYSPEDIIFLLQPADIPLTPQEEKEILLQSGKKHYSDMLGEEKPPDAWRMGIYQDALERGSNRLAREALALAKSIGAAFGKKEPIILASIARAGCPLGVLLQRALKYLGYRSRHYGTSVIRDRGIDRQAWEFLKGLSPNICFVDGWTGKGAIAGELRRSLGADARPLATLADPCGQADISASAEDWLIPFGILGATVSGLVSRTLWADSGFHKCRFWGELRPYDVSGAFADAVSSLWTPALARETAPCPRDAAKRRELQDKSAALVKSIMQDFKTDSRNRVKPGIAEAGRALLRRAPELVLLSDRTDPDLALLCGLARQRKTPIIEMGAAIAPYKAVAIIKKAL